MTHWRMFKNKQIKEKIDGGFKKLTPEPVKG